MSAPDLGHYLLTTIAENYLGIVLIGLVTPVITYGWKWINGKHSTVKDRKRFIIGSLFLGMILATIGLSVLQEFKPTGTSSFRAEIEDVAPAATTDATVVTVFVRVVNNGRRSVAWNWKLKVTTAAGQTLESTATHQPTVVTVFNQLGATNVTFSANRYLPHLLFENPVEQGAAVGGWVWFGFPPNLTREFSRMGTVYVIEFQDSVGIATTTTYVMPPGRESPNLER